MEWVLLLVSIIIFLFVVSVVAWWGCNPKRLKKRPIDVTIPPNFTNLYNKWPDHPASEARMTSSASMSPSASTSSSTSALPDEFGYNLDDIAFFWPDGGYDVKSKDGSVKHIENRPPLGMYWECPYCKQVNE